MRCNSYTGLYPVQNLSRGPEVELTYPFPAASVRLFQDDNGVDIFRRVGPPAAIRVRLPMTIVNPDDLIPTPIKSHLVNVVNKGLLARVPSDRPGVKRIRHIISPFVPIQEGPGGHFQLPGRNHAPYDLNNVAPRHGYGPVPLLVVADGLLHYAAGVEFDGLE